VAELERLLGLRRASYESADIVLDVERLTSQQVTQKLLERLGVGPAGPGA
jgi:hypothetical protein